MALTDKLKAIADAIREKTGNTAKLSLDAMPSAISGIKSNPVLQSKTVTPSTSKQTVTPDSGYDGLSSVTVNAMANGAMSDISVSSSGVITSQIGTSGYLASGTKKTKSLTTQAAKTVTPTTSNQTAVASGRYTTGAVTVKGDSNLVAGNIKKGTSIFGVTGTYEGSGGGSGGNIETCTVYSPYLVGYEATVFENGAIAYKQGSADTVENVVRNSIICVNVDMTGLAVSGGSLLLVSDSTGNNPFTFILASGSIVDIHLNDDTGEEEIPDL